jgi:uncharacterized glyoxalase superfamily protein PhnB
MSKGEFRFSYFTSQYEATVAFYRDGLELPMVGSWDRNSEDRGTLFAAASGMIEVQMLPKSTEASDHWDHRPPQGASIVIEVDDVEKEYQLAFEKGLPIKQKLTDQEWGHRSFCVLEPNGLTLYLFSNIRTDSLD